MKSSMHPLTFAVLACLLLLPWRIQSADSQPVSIAVFDFEAKEDLGKGAGRDLSTLITTLLSAESGLITVERAEIDKLLSEQELGLSGTVASDTAAKVGHLTGARVLITGRYFKAGNEQIAVAKIIGTETGRVFGELAKGGRDASPTDLAEALARKIASTTLAKADVLVAPPSARRDRVELIKAALKTERRPSVRIRIPEQHLGRLVPDPAVETELGLILRALGCDLLDDKSTAQPDLEFTGEAFSETAGRKNGMFSVKARVELKVRERATGKILISEREVRLVIDTAEHVAGKQALADAASALAVRVLPQVIR